MLIACASSAIDSFNIFFALLASGLELNFFCVFIVWWFLPDFFPVTAVSWLWNKGCMAAPFVWLCNLLYFDFAYELRNVGLCLGLVPERNLSCC